MTESEWLHGTDPVPLLDLLRRRAGDRKLRLFACACCRLVWDHLPTEECRQAVELAERYADGAVGETEREEARRRLNVAIAPLRGARGRLAQATAELLRPRFSARLVAERAWTGRGDPRPRRCALLRDLHAFRPVWIEPTWRTPDVCRLAQGIYQERRFADLPVLADALEEVGCAEQAILAHCRGAGPHVRGCWVVDRLLELE